MLNFLLCISECTPNILQRLTWLLTFAKVLPGLLLILKVARVMVYSMLRWRIYHNLIVFLYSMKLSSMLSNLAVHTITKSKLIKEIQDITKIINT